jgi:hypothetical protein
MCRRAFHGKCDRVGSITLIELARVEASWTGSGESPGGAEADAGYGRMVPPPSTA